MNKKVSVLVTMDLEIAFDHDLTEQKNVLLKLCKDTDIPLTIFTTADAASLFSNELIKLSNEKNDIGCHGVDHSYIENYQILSEATILNNIIFSTDIISKIVKNRPLCFRGPRMTTSALTQKVLIQNGYFADFSVCSQRIDIFNSQGGCWGWLWAPRKPFNPSSTNPYRKGDAPLLVVPLSSIGFPFISGIMFLFGLTFMKILFKILYFEALIRGTTIVYLFHSYEFCKKKSITIGKELNTLPFHQRIYISDHLKRYEYHAKLIQYMQKHKNVIFKRAKDLYKSE